MPTIYMTETSKEALPKRKENDHYRTEMSLIRGILGMEMGQGQFDILDPGCGDGRWGRTAWNYSGNGRSTLTTVDIDPKWNPYTDATLMDNYVNLGVEPDHYQYDFMTPAMKFGGRRFNYVVGNPPYGPSFKGRKKVEEIWRTYGWGIPPKAVENITTAEMFIRKSFDLLDKGGKMIFLLESQFASSMDRYESLWTTHAPVTQYVCSRRPSFYAGKTNATEFSIFVWAKGPSTGLNLGLPREWSVRLFTYEREKNAN